MRLKLLEAVALLRTAHAGRRAAHREPEEPVLPAGGGQRYLTVRVAGRSAGRPHPVDTRRLSLPPTAAGRVSADFQYPLSTGRAVPTASVDGLCVRCFAAWPCTTCPSLLPDPTRNVGRFNW